MIYLTSTDEAAIIAAQNKISENCHLPNSDGTLMWEAPQKAVNLDLWFITKPPQDGWGNEDKFIQQQMMMGVDLTNIEEKERDPAWFPELGPVL